jgi:hypothetical protein
MPGKVVFDEKRWPLVYVTWPEGLIDDAEFERAVLYIASLTQRKQPFAVIHDTRKASRPTPKQRAFAAAQQKADAEDSRKWLHAVAIVVSNPIIAGAITAINWIAPLPYPQKFFSSFTGAEAWVSEKLEAAVSRRA